MGYNSLTAEDCAALRDIIGADRCITCADINEDYAHDELGGVNRMPDILLKVKTTDEVSAVMRFASRRRIPVVVRGAGTGLVGGAVAMEGGILLETTQMNKILEIDGKNMTVTVQSGVLLMDLAEFVKQHGYLYPPDPGEKSATIGGNISTNAGGMRAVKYGVTRDFVRGLTAVLPNGEILTMGGKVVKNSSGYSIKDLLVGSEGTLAVITEAILKLLPLPTVSISLLIPFRSMEAAIEAVPAVIQSKVTPAAVEYMSRETILFSENYLGKKFPDSKHPAYLLLTFDGSDAETVEREYSSVADLCLDLGALDVYMLTTEERKDAVWNIRGAFLEAIKTSTTAMDECDVVVPRRRVAEYIKFTHALAEDTGLRLPSFGHAGDGNLHIYLCRDSLGDAQWERKKSEVFDELYRRAAEMGGQVSGEHGIGHAKRQYLRERLGEEQIELMRRIKAAFDPLNLLNPSKIL